MIRLLVLFLMSTARTVPMVLLTNAAGGDILFDIITVA